MAPVSESSNVRKKKNYALIPLDDGRHGVKVSAPDMFPPEYQEFADREQAEAWIAGQRRQDTTK